MKSKIALVTGGSRGFGRQVLGRVGPADYIGSVVEVSGISF